MEHLTIDSANSAVGGAPTGLGGTPLANYSIRAMASTRTWLIRVHATGAAVAGVFLAHGWCNRISSCRLSNNNGSGLHMVAALCVSAACESILGLNLTYICDCRNNVVIEDSLFVRSQTISRLILCDCPV